MSEYTNQLKNESVDRKKMSGLKKHDIWFTDNLEDKMYELAILSGYTIRELKSKRYPIYSNIMDQLAYICLKSIKPDVLNKRNQEGFLLAQKVDFLIDKGLTYEQISQDYLKSYNPQSLINTSIEVWNKETIEQLIEEHYYNFDYDEAMDTRREKGYKS